MWLATQCLLQQNTGVKKDYKQLTQMIVLHWIKRKKTALVSDMDEQRILGVSGTHLNGQKRVKMSVLTNIYIKTVSYVLQNCQYYNSEDLFGKISDT